MASEQVQAAQGIIINIQQFKEVDFLSDHPPYRRIVARVIVNPRLARLVSPDNTLSLYDLFTSINPNTMATHWRRRWWCDGRGFELAPQEIRRAL